MSDIRQINRLENLIKKCQINSNFFKTGHFVLTTFSRFSLKKLTKILSKLKNPTKKFPKSPKATKVKFLMNKTVELLLDFPVGSKMGDEHWMYHSSKVCRHLHS